MESKKGGDMIRVRSLFRCVVMTAGQLLVVGVVGILSVQSSLASAEERGDTSPGPDLVSFEGSAKTVGDGSSAREGFNLARAICRSVNGTDDVFECWDTINDRLFHPGVVQICKSEFNLDGDKIACLTAVRDKQYSRGEIHQCEEESLKSKVMQCLKRLGREHSRADCDAPQTFHRMLKDAYEAHEDGYFRQGQDILKALMHMVEPCA